MVTIALAVLIVQVPVLDQALAVSTTASVLVLGGWCALAVTYFVAGIVKREPLTYRIGVGIFVLSASQLIRFVDDDQVLTASIRLVGALVLVMGLATQLRTAMRAAASQVRRIAELTAERDHEMHNVLSGLDGMAHVLGHGGVDERAVLADALREEITRLRDLLEQRSSGESCAVEPVLSRLVTVRKSAGLDVRLDVEPDLHAAVPATVLAQVMTNLLANCERHAPGAKVWVSARERQRIVRIEVRDDGPGLAASVRGRALERGVHDPDRGGSGLGLHVSARLLAEVGGSLHLLPGQVGCVAEVAVPAGEPV
ncbi:MAG: HAMP domain-containing histidine kinase [Kutzneria sp.]|nr:HAMP domain-containing histidine kinase [Kutzneria sp.]